MKKLNRIRMMLIGGAVAAMTVLVSAYYFGGVTMAAVVALAVPLALPFVLGKFGNSAVRAHAGQPDQLKHHELRSLVDAVNDLLVSARRAEEELGITLEGISRLGTVTEPVSSWMMEREGAVPFYILRNRRLDALQLDEISKVRKALGNLEKDIRDELVRKVADEEREVTTVLGHLGYTTQQTNQVSERRSDANKGIGTLGPAITAHVEKRAVLVTELEKVADELETAYHEIEHEFPSVAEFQQHLQGIRAHLAAMEARTAARLIQEMSQGIAERPRPRFKEDRMKLLRAIDAIERTGALDLADLQVQEAFKGFTRFALQEKNPLRYRRLLDHTRKFPDRAAEILESLEQECLHIDRIVQKDYIIEYKEKFQAIDKEVRVSDIVLHAEDVAKRLVHLKQILDQHEDERRITENYIRVENRIRRLLEKQGSVGPEDLKVRTPERYLDMFAHREATVVLENGRLRIATDQDKEPLDPHSRSEDSGNARMEQEG